MANIYGLTPRQAELLAFIERHTADHGWSPSIREMAVGIGLPRNAVGTIHRMLHALHQRGHVRLLYHKGRSVMPVEGRAHG